MRTAAISKEFSKQNSGNGERISGKTELKADVLSAQRFVEDVI